MNEDNRQTEGSSQLAVSERPLKLSAKVPWPVTIKFEWLEKGIIVIPLRLSNHMAGTNTVHICYDHLDEVLPYDENERIVNGLSNFYFAKAVAEDDTVHLQLRALEPTRIFAYSSWKRAFEELLRIQPGDMDWQSYSLRDCVIVTLARLRRPAHCRDIHSKLSTYKDVSLDAVAKTLSRYYPLVFENVDSDKWKFGSWTD